MAPWMTREEWRTQAAERWGVGVQRPEDGEEGEEPDPGEDFEVGAGEGEVQEDAADDGRGEVAEGRETGHLSLVCESDFAPHLFQFQFEGFPVFLVGDALFLLFDG